MDKCKHLIFYASKDFEADSNWLSIHIHNSSGRSYFFSFVELNGPTNYSNYDPYFYNLSYAGVYFLVVFKMGGPGICQTTNHDVSSLYSDFRLSHCFFHTFRRSQQFRSVSLKPPGPFIGGVSLRRENFDQR
jgi:hypothetical protein